MLSLQVIIDFLNASSTIKNDSFTISTFIFNNGDQKLFVFVNRMSTPPT